MATIKYSVDEITNEKKIILKDGKASFECCDLGECFFYPSIGIREGLYTAADLPDFVNLTFNETYLYQKSGDMYFSTTPIGIFPAGNTRIIIYNRGGPIWTPGNEDFDLLWAWQGLFEDGWQLLVSVEGSLISFSNIGNFIVQDLFADTYTVTGIFNGQQDSRTVSRIPPSIPLFPKTCVWQGDCVTLKYNGRFTYDREPPFTLQGNFKFQVNGNNKTGFQNTPVGSYEGGYSVS